MSTTKQTAPKSQDPARLSANGEPIWIDFEHPLIKRATLLRREGRKQEAELCWLSYLQQQGRVA